MLVIPAQAQQQLHKDCCTELCEDFRSDLLADPTDPEKRGVYAMLNAPFTIEGLLEIITLMHADMAKYQNYVDCLKRQVACCKCEESNGRNSFLI